MHIGVRSLAVVIFSFIFICPSERGVRAYLWRRDSCWALRGKLIERAAVLVLLGPFTHIAQQQEKRVAE
jgi:hypothetical protein